MKVDQVIEYDDGSSLTFRGEIEGAELETVLRLGLTALVANGYILPEHAPIDTDLEKDHKTPRPS